jgi:precorrin-6A synthase
MDVAYLAATPLNHGRTGRRRRQSRCGRITRVREILLIGIGTGNPEHLTVQAVNALRRVDVIFLLDKGEAKRELIELRREILDRYTEPGSYRVVEAQDPQRDRKDPAYAEAVRDWRHRRAEACEEMIACELGEAECGAFLVWGDPTLYDSMLGVLEDILARGTVRFEHHVIPGISSVAALTAAHRTSVNRVGRPVEITTGRRLAYGFPDGVDDVVVMLDSRAAFRTAGEPDAEIFWGAYLGGPDEILISGRVAEVGERIETARAAAREAHGWVMDTYLLRRGSSDG